MTRLKHLLAIATIGLSLPISAQVCVPPIFSAEGLLLLDTGQLELNIPKNIRIYLTQS